jgi:Holliday junction resolvase
MRSEVYLALRQINNRWLGLYGKIVEKLLAISFDPLRGGFDVENRSTEGVDIELVGTKGKYAVEVKTTSGSKVEIKGKDIEGLRAKAAKDNYVPAVAVLRLQLLDTWIIAKADHLLPNVYTPERLSRDSITELEQIGNGYFETTVLELKQDILNPPGGTTPLEYLAAVLARESLRVPWTDQKDDNQGVELKPRR